MSSLVGLHGIAQQQVGRHQLKAPWARALADGLERSAGCAAPKPPLDVAFYGDLFLAPAPDAGSKGPGLGDAKAWDDLTQGEISDVIAAAGEILSEDELELAAEEAAENKGFSRAPLPLQKVGAALDRRFGARASSLFVGELRQVHRYLSDPQLKAQVDARIADSVADDCQVLIGHSLGSVVAFEYLRQHPDRSIKLFLTLGSPLGLQTIQRHLPDPSFGSAEGVPSNVDLWVNLRDPRDPVACAGDLSSWWPGVRDSTVNNEKAAHSAERYLSKKQTGDAVLSVLPELAR